MALISTKNVKACLLVDQESCQFDPGLLKCVAEYNFIFIRSIFQYYMFCLIYGTLNESQRDLRMTSFYTLLECCYLYQE